MLRPPVPALRDDDGAASHLNKRVTVHHPGYNGPHDALISLLAADGPDGGLDHETVHIICAVIANNRFDGYLTLDIDGLHRPNSDSVHFLLPPGKYFFHVPHLIAAGNLPSASASQQHGVLLPPTPYQPQPAPESTSSPFRYPIVPFFDSWSFPHDRLPRAWLNVAWSRSYQLQPASSAVRVRDNTCRLTNRREATEYAHIIPKNDGGWFRRNDMARYASLGRHVGAEKDDTDNIILLRSDVHLLWDNDDFVLVPKRTDGAGTVMVAHIMHTSPEPLALYHNLETQPLLVPKEFLFARLAWTIFKQVRSFLLANQARVLTVWDEDTNLFSTGSYDPRQCQALVDRRTRSNSPKKRKPQDMTGFTQDSSDEHQRRKFRCHCSDESRNAGCPSDSGIGEAYSPDYRGADVEEREYTQQNLISESESEEEIGGRDASEEVIDEELIYERRGRPVRRTQVSIEDSA